ncbi:hypothetical protein BDV59DRAFT_167661 [Aspergillus ambiguus]|uniref:uncharacterized protein n=1 Tax=Aspergillus ambiguus TaxID=176160 RepID=UPI003CCE4EBE
MSNLARRLLMGMALGCHGRSLFLRIGFRLEPFHQVFHLQGGNHGRVDDKEMGGGCRNWSLPNLSETAPGELVG